MTNVYSISNPESVKSPEEHFQEAYKWYPHNPSRKAKGKARTIYMKIIQPGGTDTMSKNEDSGLLEEQHLQATPEEILEGIKEYRKGLPKIDPNSYTVDTSYVPGMNVWLNKGRWE